jgi:hypothetical protein
MKPHRLAWFRSKIGKTVKRRDFVTNLFIEIPVEDNWKAQQLFKTQFDLHLRYK